VAFVLEAPVIQRILTHLGLQARAQDGSQPSRPGFKFRSSNREVARAQRLDETAQLGVAPDSHFVSWPSATRTPTQSSACTLDEGRVVFIATRADVGRLTWSAEPERGSTGAMPPSGDAAWVSRINTRPVGADIATHVASHSAKPKRKKPGRFIAGVVALHGEHTLPFERHQRHQRHRHRWQPLHGQGRKWS